MKMENEINHSKDSLIRLTGNGLFDGAVWIGICSAYGYHLVYVYECAYCNHFQIPTELVKVNLLKLSYALSGLLFSWFISLFIIDAILFYTRSIKLPPWFRARIGGIDKVWCIITLSSALFLFWAYGNVYLFAIFSLMAVAEILFGWFLGPDKGSSPPFSSRVNRLLGRKAVLILLILYCTTAISQNLGTGIARHKTDFITLRGVGQLENSQKLVCVAEYGGVLVCAKMDSLDRIKPVYQTVDFDALSPDTAISMRKIHINHITIDTVFSDSSLQGIKKLSSPGGL
jgi:hypothetical protein